jgi:hypothetical protein
MKNLDNYEINFSTERESSPRHSWIFLKWVDNHSGYFGEINIKCEPEGNMKIWTETMGKEFVKELLCKLVDDAELME